MSFVMRSKVQARLAQGLRPISFRLGQVTSGHGQLHLQVEELRLLHLAHYAPQGCFALELRSPVVWMMSCSRWAPPIQ